MSTDTTEKGLEDLIVKAMTGHATLPVQVGAAEEPLVYGGTGWMLGRSQDYAKDYAIDLVQFCAFLEDTQPALAKALDLAHDSTVRHAFLSRVQPASHLVV